MYTSSVGNKGAYMTNQKVIEAINKHYGAELAFQRKGESQVIVSGERTYVQKFTIEGKEFTVDTVAVDYYGEFSGNYPHIDKWLIDFAKKFGAYWEWENPGYVCLAR